MKLVWQPSRSRIVRAGLFSLVGITASNAEEPKYNFRQSTVELLDFLPPVKPEVGILQFQPKEIDLSEVKSLWAYGSETGITDSLESISYQLPNGALLVAGLRERSFWHNLNEDFIKQNAPHTVRIMLHGSPTTDNLSFSTPRVKSVAAESVGVKDLEVECPQDWPKRGLNVYRYKDQKEKNYVLLAQLLNYQFRKNGNRLFIVNLSCNYDDKVIGHGASPFFFRRMLLAKDEEIADLTVCMSEGGKVLWSDSFTNAVENEKNEDKTTTDAKGKSVTYKSNGMQVFVYKRDAKGRYIFDEKGLYTSDEKYKPLVGPQDVDGGQIEAYEIWQHGPNYLRYCSALFNLPKDGLLESLQMRPQFGNWSRQLLNLGEDTPFDKLKAEVVNRKNFLRDAFSKKADDWERSIHLQFNKKWPELNPGEILKFQGKEGFHSVCSPAEEGLDKRLLPLALRQPRFLDSMPIAQIALPNKEEEVKKQKPKLIGVPEKEEFHIFTESRELPIDISDWIYQARRFRDLSLKIEGIGF